MKSSKSIKSFITSHINTFYLQLDPIRDCTFSLNPNQKSKQQSFHLNLHFAIPLLFIALNLFQSILLSNHELASFLDKDGFDLFLNCLFTHQLFPKGFWNMNDIMILFYTIQVCAIFGCFIGDLFFDPKIIMFTNGTGFSKLSN